MHEPSTATHTPVMLERTLELFAPVMERAADESRQPVIVDGTLGLGGHTAALLAEFPTVRIVGVDRDTSAIDLAAARVVKDAERFTAVHARFDDFAAITPALPPDSQDAAGPCIDAVLLDCGVSSMQLDLPERGFSYAVDAPLDMRMDTTAGRTAGDVLNTYDVTSLTRVIRDYGEERFAAKIARAIVRHREQALFTHSAQLVELLYAEIPAAARRSGGHPAKRTFQALRIEVNAELDALRAAVTGYLDLLRHGGRALFMAYHSLEDKIVKRELAVRTSSTTPAGLPVELPGHEPAFALITRGAEQASQNEIATNPRSASVRVRCAERITSRKATR